MFFKVDRTFIVSQGEVEVPSSLGGQREQEVMSILWFIKIHSTQSLNYLRGQRSNTWKRRSADTKWNKEKMISFEFLLSDFICFVTLSSCGYEGKNRDSCETKAEEVGEEILWVRGCGYLEPVQNQRNDLFMFHQLNWKVWWHWLQHCLCVFVFVMLLCW